PYLILTGRSALNSEQREHIATLERLGATVAYYAVDVTDPVLTDELIQAVQNSYGKLNGVLHSAGVNHDNFILKKPAEEFLKVLAPKIDGTLNIDHATRNLDLDFFVLFSSITAIMGNPGQADYAVANGFLDSFA